MIHTHNISVGELSRIVEGDLNLGSMPPIGGKWEPVRRLITDYSQLSPGDVFVSLTEPSTLHPLVGGEVFARGALGVISGRKVEPWAGKISIRVSDTRVAACRLHDWARSHFVGTRIAVCGTPSAEKTGRLISSILTSAKKCRAHFLNPDDRSLEILELDQDTDLIVSAASHNRPETVSNWLMSEPPNILIVAGSEKDDKSSNSCEQVDAWCQALQGLRPGTLVILNGDDPILSDLPASKVGSHLRVGRSGSSDLQITQVHCDGATQFCFDGQSIRSRLLGRHNVLPLAMAFAVAKALKLSPADTVAAIERFELPIEEQEIVSCRDIRWVLGAHRGHWSLVESSLALFADLPCQGTRAVINVTRDAAPFQWTQRELGAAIVQRTGADRLVGLGPATSEFLDGARNAGMPSRALKLWMGPDQADLCDDFRNEIRSGDVVLLLGSNRGELAPFYSSWK